VRASNSVQNSKPCQCHPEVVPSAYYVHAEITYFLPDALGPSNLHDNARPSGNWSGPNLTIFWERYRDHLCISKSRSQSNIILEAATARTTSTVIPHLRLLVAFAPCDHDTPSSQMGTPITFLSRDMPITRIRPIIEYLSHLEGLISGALIRVKPHGYIL
jgi:hypothetical protein